MRTLLVTGLDPVPARLLEIIENGSTSVDHVSVDDLVTYVGKDALGVDRIVFWAGPNDPALRSVALNYLTAAGDERRQTMFFVTAGPVESLDGMPQDEVLIWPGDEDKLKLLFMTGG